MIRPRLNKLLSSIPYCSAYGQPTYLSSRLCKYSAMMAALQVLPVA